MSLSNSRASGSGSIRTETNRSSTILAGGPEMFFTPYAQDNGNPCANGNWSASSIIPSGDIRSRTINLSGNKNGTETSSQHDESSSLRAQAPRAFWMNETRLEPERNNTEEIVPTETEAYFKSFQENIRKGATPKNPSFGNSPFSSSFRSVSAQGDSSNSRKEKNILHKRASPLQKSKSSSYSYNDQKLSRKGTPKTPSISKSVSGSGQNKQSHCNSMSTTLSSNCVVAVCEGRGTACGEVGIAAISISDPKLIISQLSDSPSYVRTIAKLVYFAPEEILIPTNNALGKRPLDSKLQESKLLEEIEAEFPNAQIKHLQRRYYNDNQGWQTIHRICAPDCLPIEIQIKNKFYGLAAACALLKFLEETKNFFYAPKSVWIEFQASNESAMIDAGTASHVELLVSSLNPKSKFSLFGFLKEKISSPSGERYLRANLFQPLIERDAIEERLDVVDEIISKPGLYHSLHSILGSFGDINQLLSLCVMIPVGDGIAFYEQRLNNIIALKNAVELIEPLGMALEGVESKILTEFREQLQDERYLKILEEVTKVVSDNAKVQKGSSTMKLQRCFVIKSGCNGMLDISKQAYCEIVEDIEQLVASLSEEHGLPMKLGYNTARGYHIQLQTGKGRTGLKKRDLPKKFIQPVETKSGILFSTEALIKADIKAKEYLKDIISISDKVVRDLLGKIRDQISALFKLSEIVSKLDMLVSFSFVSQKDGFVRPLFGDATIIQGGRHPILEQINNCQVVPNDVIATAESTFHVLTGTNMSGKTTYLRQIVLLQIMAQVGCYVPANYATFRIANSILSRVGTGDSIECNASTFMLEMKEISFILSRIRSNSLVILDELGRGTSTEEGTAICWAIAEELIKSRAFCFLATHFSLMNKLEDLYPTSVNHCFITEKRKSEKGPELYQTHRLADGSTLMDHYGLDLAKATSLPRELINDAVNIIDALKSGRNIVPVCSEKELETINAVRLFKRLVFLSGLFDNTEEAIDSLQELKAQFQVEEDDYEVEERET